MELKKYKVKEWVTTSLILQVNPLSESDVLIDLLTADLGRITVISRGVRLLKSRLRYALEPYSLIEASIIDSRSGLRMINAQLINNLYYRSGGSPSRFLVRFVNLLARITPPENPEGWQVEILNFLENSEPKTAKDFSLAAAYVLYRLGYLDLEKEVRLPVKDLKQLLLQENVHNINLLIIQSIEGSHL